MIDFFSKWAEQVIIAIVIGSIIEMILPNNNTRNYIKMVIGIYILFTIIYPAINNKNKLSVDNIDVDSFIGDNYNQNGEKNVEVNQESMDERLQNLYIDELENNIKSKVQQEGYNVSLCKVDANLLERDDENGIKKISIVLSEKIDNTNNMKENQLNIQEIEDVEIRVGLAEILNGKGKDENLKITNKDIKNLKDSLCEYYEVETSKINISIK